MLNIDKLISDARKNGDKVRLTVLTNIKAKIQEYNTAKISNPPYDDKAEFVLLSKMAKELMEDIDTAKKANRLDKVDEPQAQLDIVTEYLPKSATREEIENVIKTSPDFVDGKISQKSMGAVIKYVKSKLSNADGKLTSEIVRSYIG